MARKNRSASKRQQSKGVSSRAINVRAHPLASVAPSIPAKRNKLVQPTRLHASTRSASEGLAAKGRTPTIDQPQTRLHRRSGTLPKVERAGASPRKSGLSLIKKEGVRGRKSPALSLSTRTAPEPDPRKSSHKAREVLHCKKKPDSRKAARSGGGGKKKFVPWCR